MLLAETTNKQLTLRILESSSCGTRAGPHGSLWDITQMEFPHFRFGYCLDFWPVNQQELLHRGQLWLEHELLDAVTTG